MPAFRDRREAAIRTCAACSAEIPTDAPACPQCGLDVGDQGAPSPFPPGKVLESRYRIDVEVGRGGMGVVYRGTDLTLKRPVAIKALRATEADAQVLSRFLREARALARVEHAGLVPVYAVGRDEGVYYMVMKFVEGRTLQALLRDEGPQDPQRVRKLIADICGALETLHGAGLIHRDLKPGNLIVGSDGRLTVMDLGIVKSVGENTQTTSTALGTPKYMAPEMLNDHNVDGRADLYSLGIIAYELLAGAPPFDGPTPMAILFKQAHEPAEPLRKRAPRVPKDLAAAVERALAKDRDQRYADAGEMAAAFLEGARVAGRPGRPSWLLPAGIAGGVGVAFVVGLLVVPRSPEGAGAGSGPGTATDAPTVVKVGSSPPPPTAPAAPPTPATQPPTAVLTQPPTAAPTQAVPTVRMVSITVTSDPAGTTVYDSGKGIGRTPLTFKRPQANRVLTLVLKRDGYGDARVNVSLGADATAHARLEAMFELVP